MSGDVRAAPDRCSTTKGRPARLPARPVFTGTSDLEPPSRLPTCAMLRVRRCRPSAGLGSPAGLRDRQAAAMPSSMRRDQTVSPGGRADERTAASSTGVSSILDDIDRRLLSLLADDGRRSYADLAHEVGLSAPSVYARVKKLE